MKKNSIILIMSILIFITGCGSVTEINPTPKDTDTNKYLKEDQYRRGYNDAIIKERLKWVKAGYDDAMDVVKRYTKDISSLEAGKYAVKNKFVTYPKLIAINNGGTIALKSLGCEISREMTVDDIFHYYNRNKYNIPTYTQQEVADLQSKQTFNATISSNQSNIQDLIAANTTSNQQAINTNVALPVEQTIKATSNSYVQNNAQTKKVFMTLTKDYKSKNLIDKYNLSCNETTTGYSCEFATQSEKDWFCSETKSCN